MHTTTRVWISPQAHERLHRELDTLRFLFSAGIADGDTDENATAVRRAWEIRIQQIHDLLINAVVGEDPPNDGIAEPGMSPFATTPPVTPTPSCWVYTVPNTPTWRSIPSNPHWAPPSQAHAPLNAAPTD